MNSNTPNNFVSLNGKLSRDPKIIGEGKGKPFAVLSVSTRNTYEDENGETQFRKTIWHNDCLIFNEDLVNQVRELQKNDRVLFLGELNYRKFLTQECNVKNAASIIVKSVEKIHLN